MASEKIYKAINGVINDLGAISKDKKTEGYASFKYRGIDDVYNNLHPLFAKHGIFVSPCVESVERVERVNQKGTVLAYVTVKVRYTFYADDGSHFECVTVGEGMDSGDKGTPKAQSIAMKYALFQVFCIATDEMPDPDAQTDMLAPKGAQTQRQAPQRQQQQQQRPPQQQRPIQQYQRPASQQAAPQANPISVVEARKRFSECATLEQLGATAKSFGLNKSHPLFADISAEYRSAYGRIENEIASREVPDHL